MHIRHCLFLLHALWPERTLWLVLAGMGWYNTQAGPGWNGLVQHSGWSWLEWVGTALWLVLAGMGWYSTLAGPGWNGWYSTLAGPGWNVTPLLPLLHTSPPFTPFPPPPLSFLHPSPSSLHPSPPFTPLLPSPLSSLPSFTPTLAGPGWNGLVQVLAGMGWYAGPGWNGLVQHFGWSWLEWVDTALWLVLAGPGWNGLVQHFGWGLCVYSL